MTTIDAHGAKHQAAGSPNGGQYAAQVRKESTDSLPASDIREILDSITDGLPASDPWRNDPERISRLALATINRPGDPVIGALVNEFGPIGAFEEITLGTETEYDGHDLNDIRAAWHTGGGAHGASIAVLKSRLGNYDFVTPEDGTYPKQLSDLGNEAPLGLWTKGNTKLLDQDKNNLISFGGARSATSYGHHVATEFGADIAGRNKTVVASASYGIDGAVHRAAIAAQGPAIAVLSSGIDRAYPAGHSDLIDRIAETGLVITEVPPGTTPVKKIFMSRNRINAALAGSTIIVEAGMRSGSNDLAAKAKQLCRDVYAVPGPIVSAASSGTNEMIRNGTAKLMTHPREMYEN